MTAVLTFRLSGHLFGVPLERVREVPHELPLTPVPLADPSVVGLGNLRGRIVSAIDLRVQLGLCSPLERPPHVQIIADLEDGPVAFLVDEVCDSEFADPATFETLPVDHPATATGAVLGAHKLEHELLVIIDPDRASCVSQTGPTFQTPLADPQMGDRK